ncbi:hypothetical protein BJX66DRAFT_193448 [Aspergillus keveii]|uniref:Uncharacterized protein n=1 Tax=Aspergillus keveii TaxID=714993 RepID=A0ABR4G6J2_9EURO
MGVGGASPVLGNPIRGNPSRTPVSVSTNPVCAGLLAAGWAVLYYLKKAERISEKHGRNDKEISGNPRRTQETQDPSQRCTPTLAVDCAESGHLASAGWRRSLPASILETQKPQAEAVVKAFHGE